MHCRKKWERCKGGCPSAMPGRTSLTPADLHIALACLCQFQLTGTSIWLVYPRLILTKGHD